jgi:copper chaperone CopZ
MKNWKFLALVTGLMALASWARAETTGNATVTLSNVHICCGSCVDIITATVAKVPGAQVTPDEDAKTIVLTAPDKATLQKAVDALVTAGFFGKSSDPDVKVSAPSGAKDGKVQTLTVTGVHLCCGQCVSTVNSSLGKVPGVTGNDCAANAKSFTITGNFNPPDVFAALNQAGMAGHVATVEATPATAAPGAQTSATASK